MNDAKGNKLGDALDNINNPGVGKTWKFKALFLREPNKVNSWNQDEIEITGF